MMVLDRLTRRIRRSGDNPAIKSGSDWFNWARVSTAHRAITDNDALSLTAFYRCISLLSGTIAGFPLQVFEEDPKDDEKKTKLKTPDTAYLWARPNIEMTRQSMWERVVADEIRGNGFIFVDKDERTTLPIGIWWLSRDRVRVGRASDGMKIYEVASELPMIDYKQGGEIIHIPNWGGALVGYDPIQVAAQALALGISAEEYASRMFLSGQIPPGIISSDLPMTEQQADALQARWREKHSGLYRAQDIAVLGNGAKFQQIAIDMERMQMEALRRFQVEEICRLLGVPPHLVADVTGSTSWGTGIEEQNRGLIVYTLMAHINRIEQAIDDTLLVRELSGRYAKFNLSALLRGSTLQRYQALRLADFMTINEKRRLEDLERMEDERADDVFQQINTAPLDAFDAAAADSPIPTPTPSRNGASSGA